MKQNSKHCTYNDSTQAQLKKNLLKLEDIATSLQYGSVDNDQRVQLKMPSQVVSLLDKVFSQVNRSKLLTQLAVQALLQHFRFQDRDFLTNHQLEEQRDLDQLWNYLQERERGHE